jgi:hypothetical protein
LSTPDRDPPFEGGSQPVPHTPPEVPTGGRSAMQIVVVAIGALVLIGTLIMLVVPLLL